MIYGHFEAENIDDAFARLSKHFAELANPDEQGEVDEHHLGLYDLGVHPDPSWPPPTRRKRVP